MSKVDDFKKQVIALAVAKEDLERSRPIFLHEDMFGTTIYAVVNDTGYLHLQKAHIPKEVIPDFIKWLTDVYGEDNKGNLT